MTFDWAKAHPINATFLGLSDEDGLLDTPSLAANARDLATIREWQKQLAAISLDGAALKDVDDAKLLGAQLTGMERQYTVYKTFEKDPSGPSVAILSAIYTQFLHLPVAGTSGATAGDVTVAWEKIIARLSGAPAYIAAGNALVTRPGHLYGITGAEQLEGAPSLLSGPLTDAAKAQLSAERFAAFEKARDATLAAMAQTKKFIDEHAAAWPENYAMGRDAYNAMLRDEELLPFDSSEIECIGRDELAHGWAVQVWMEQLAKERGTPIGPQSGGGLAPGGPGADRVLSRTHRATARLREAAQRGGYSRLARRNQSGGDAEIHAAGFAGCFDVFAAFIQQERDGILLHHSSHVARRSRQESGRQSGFRSRSHPFHRRARGDARTLFAAFDCAAQS